MFSPKLQIISGTAILLLISVLSLITGGEEGLSIQMNETTLMPFTIRGASMEPTLKDGERVYIDVEYYKSHLLARGDIVAFKLKMREKPFVKRVIALEGDKLRFSMGRNIYVNGIKIEEPYLADKEYPYNPSKLKVLFTPLNLTNGTVPQRTFLALGDNRKNSFDGKDYGFVPMGYIIGKVAG